jgi:hypothetical protein
MRFLSYTITTWLLVQALIMPSAAMAAQFHSGSTVNISSSEQPRDAYIAGSTVNIDAPVQGDLVVAGGNVTIANDVETNVIAAGGTLSLKGKVGSTVRVAGGTVLLTGAIGRDAIIFGGEVTVAETATIAGDLVVNGGTVEILAPVSGKVVVNGGTVKLNSRVAGNVDGEVGTLELGPKTDIGGNLTYRSSQEASKDQDALIRGTTNYQFIDRTRDQNRSAELASTGFFYSLFASLLTTLALVYLLRRTINHTVIRAHDSLLKSLLIGFVSLFVVPPILLALLIFAFWLGLIASLAFILLLNVSYFVAEIFLGWWFLRWWFGRNQQSYDLDWRAAVVGVLAMTILWLVPVLGWIIALGLWMVALGGLIQQLIAAQQVDQAG